jgi:phosphohistidine swiveling domain-containing protein
MSAHTMFGGLVRTGPGQRAAPDVMWLDERAALDRRVTGAKAANLALAKQVGLPVYDGFVITTLGTSALEQPNRMRSSARWTSLGQAWADLTGDGAIALAVRSSSVVEDSTTSSMAGRFVSVLHVRGWDAFVDAVFEVVGSAAGTELGDAPMAVLVQPMADARIGGVLFGLDPLTGDTSTMRLSVIDGLPDQIVSGAASGVQVVISRRGSVRSTSGPVPSALGRRQLSSLASIARQVDNVFGGPQDIEWLLDAGGTVRLLQSRPITASALPAKGSHLLGPGPVAETFPDALAPLERDLWVPPLDRGIREAVRLVGVANRRTLASTFVVDVGGRVAVDLDVLGVSPKPRRLLRRLDPRPSARRLLAAWRMGRLRAGFPAIAHDLITSVDSDLLDVPAPGALGDFELLTVLGNAGQTLVALHAHEVLAGFFLDEEASVTAGAAVALAELSRARAAGLDDDEIIARQPSSLLLVPPRIGIRRMLPPTPAMPRLPTGEGDHPTAAAREALRMRIRFVHELTAIVAEELGSRLVARGQISTAQAVRLLDLAMLRELVLDPGQTAAPVAAVDTVPPLPARFRFAADGSIVPEVGRDGETIGVSPGRVEGVVTYDPADADGKVLVTDTLAPDLAAALSRAAGIVSETGSPLSHLAILAREYHVPVVVGVASPRSALPEGTRVRIDGSAGTVEVVADRREASLGVEVTG